MPEEIRATPNLMEIYGQQEVERNGIKLPLESMLKLCPIPQEQRDGSKENEYAARFLLDAGVEMPEEHIPEVVQIERAEMAQAQKKTF